MFLGLDIGTTRIKMTLLSREGEVLDTGSSRVSPIVGPNGEVEIDPKVWIDTVVDLLEGKNLTGVEAIGLSGQMHSLVLLDRERKPLGNAILWADSRGAEEERWLRKFYGAELLKVGGSIPSRAFTLVKLLYIKNSHPEIFKRIYRVCLSKDFIGGWLTGNYDTELTDASATLMLDLVKGDWNFELLEDLGIPRGIFPEVHNSIEVRGFLKEETADILGIRSGVPVVYGAGDQESAAFGVGVLKPGKVMFSVSTGSQIFVPVEEPVLDKRLHNFRHVEGYHVMGAVQNAGLALDWAMKTLGFKDFDELTELAKESDIGSGGVFFFPYITPERTPVMRDDLSGILYNMRLSSRRSDIARSIIEGVVLCVYDAWKCVEEVVDLKDPKIVLVGGVLKNPIFRSNLVSMIGGRISILRNDLDPSSLGAALMARSQLYGLENSLKIAESNVTELGAFERDPRLLNLYREFLKTRQDVFGEV